MDSLESNELGIPSDTCSSTPPSSTPMSDFQRALVNTARGDLKTRPLSRFDDGSTCPHGLSISPESKADLCEQKAWAWSMHLRGFACRRPGGCPAMQGRSQRPRCSDTWED